MTPIGGLLRKLSLNVTCQPSQFLILVAALEVAVKRYPLLQRMAARDK